MSFTKQFVVKDETRLNDPSQDGLPTPTSKDYQATFAAALGLNTAGMVEVIIHDLCSMIDKEQRFSLEGYIQCLYRIASHKIAWECIAEAFSKKNEPVPAKIRNLFGKDEAPRQKNAMVAE